MSTNVNSSPVDNQAQPPVNKPNNKFKNKNTKPNNKETASSQINKDAKPMEFQAAFTGFVPTTRGNAFVDVNPTFPEYFASAVAPVLKTYQERHNYYDDNGQLRDVEYLCEGLNAGLNFAAAVKLINATPESSLGEIAAVSEYGKFLTTIPPQYSMVLDLVGKTDYYDTVIRIENNATLIQRLFIKAIKHAWNNDDFRNQCGHLNIDPARIADLTNITDRNIETVVFNDAGSVKWIKKTAQEYLTRFQSQDVNLRIVDSAGNNHDVIVACPQLESNPTKNQVLLWFQKLGDHINHRDNLVLAGLLSIVEPRWIGQYDTVLATIDRAFAGTLAANVTPREVFNLADLHHYTEFFNHQTYKQLIEETQIYYESTIINRLQFIIKLVKQGKQTFGNAAQLVINRTPTQPFRNYDFQDTFDIDVNSNSANELQCSKKLQTPGSIVLSGAFRITRDVRYTESYVGYAEKAFKNIVGELGSGTSNKMF